MRHGRLIYIAVALFALWPPTATQCKDPMDTPGAEIQRAPAKTAARVNPYAGNPEAIAAGKKIYERRCANCHGPEGRGNAKTPDLHDPAIQQAPAGALFWLLKNGDIGDGMPAWSSLPDQQLWQLVTFLHTLG
jgi:mono/diheme cytochrome c family protein